jgi:hypothetical protein
VIDDWTAPLHASMPYTALLGVTAVASAPVAGEVDEPVLVEQGPPFGLEARLDAGAEVSAVAAARQVSGRQPAGGAAIGAGPGRGTRSP